MPVKVRRQWLSIRQAPAWMVLIGALVAAPAVAGSARTAVADPVSVEVQEAITAAEGPSTQPSASAQTNEGVTAIDAISVLQAQVPALVGEGVTVSDAVSVIQAQVPALVGEGVTVSDAVSVVPGQEPVAVGEAVTVADTVSVQPQAPTAVVIRSFTARRSRAGIVIRWRTASEAGLLGFDLYRSGGGVDLKVNRRLIPARAVGTTRGASYRLLDRRARLHHRYVYTLEAVLATGARSWSVTARA